MNPPDLPVVVAPPPRESAFRKLSPRRVFLPPSLLSPWVMLAVGFVPQSVLLVINWQAWDLARGEANAQQKGMAAVLLILAMVSLLVPVGLAAWMWLRKSLLPRAAGFVPLVAGSLYLGAVWSLSGELIPRAVMDWMLPPDQWMLKQFALVSPVALFGALRVLCPDSQPDRNGLPEAVMPLASALLLPVAAIGYLFVSAMAGGLAAAFMQGQSTAAAQAGTSLLIAGYIAITILTAAAFMRLGIGWYLTMRAWSVRGLVMMSAFVALLLPLAGLLLNASIPFPVDFQSPAIYVLAALNGLLVTLPNLASIVWQRVVWLLQCLSFPFTVYFFAVFVPMLPLAPLGMLCMGLGVLIYVPSLLFLLHGYRLLDGFRLSVRDGHKAVFATAGIAAVLAWPAVVTISAVNDKRALHQALDYLQYPDYGRDLQYSGNPAALRSALHHMRDFKQGIYLPYLSEYYNWLVFDNLVLPTSRMNALHEAFFGEPFPEASSRLPLRMFSAGQPRRSAAEVLSGPAGERPSSDAVVTRSLITSSSHEGIRRSRLTLTVSNPTSQPTEYATRIQIPPGVLVSGLTLRIGTEDVPGRIFEKRAAEWVYQKITEVRPIPRDPAILKYTGPQEAELRVYPVAAREERHVTVEFQYPDGWKPVVTFGDATHELESSTSSPAIISRSPDGYVSVLIPREVARELPSAVREPCLTILVDCSEGSIYEDSGKLAEALTRTAKAFPDATDARVLFVNYETLTPSSGAGIPAADLRAGPVEGLGVPAGFVRGGFLPGQAIKQALWQHHVAMASGERIGQYPHIVILRGTSTPALPDTPGNLADFATLSPDFPGYWTWAADSENPVFTTFSGMETDSPSAAVPVSIVKAGEEVFALKAGVDAAWFGSHPTSSLPRELEAVGPAKGSPSKGVPALTEISEAFSAALEPWNIERARTFEPSQNHGNGVLKKLLANCRSTGTLVPSAAYMVVEDSAQWKMLSLAEKKTTKGSEALQLAEDPAVTPEPGTVVLVLMGLLAAWGIPKLLRRFSGTGVH